MQLIGAATPDVPNQVPMPQASKQLFNVYPIPPVHVIVRLLAGWVGRNQYGYVNPAFSGCIWRGEINLVRSGCGGNEQKMEENW